MYKWFDFEEDVSTDAIPGKYILTIADEHGEEVATIVHRASDMFPLDGPVAAQKERNAQRIVDALNAYDADPEKA